MRKLIAAFAIAASLSLPAFAGDDDGEIRSLDAEAMTITLDNGQTYKLPAEMDISALREGQQVLLAYREVDGGVPQITDMEVSE